MAAAIAFAWRMKAIEPKSITVPPAPRSNIVPPIVQRLWNYCNVLRDDGMSCGDEALGSTSVHR